MENYEKNEQKLTTGVDENGEDCFDEMFEEGLKKKNVVTNWWEWIKFAEQSIGVNLI